MNIVIFRLVGIMTVISKIQKLRAENRREQKRKWKQKSKNDQTKALSNSSSAIRKKRNS